MDKNTKNKHLTLEERIEIQEDLYKEMTFKAIAKRVGKDPTTIAKEVKLHAQSYRSGYTCKEGTCPRLLKAPYVCNGCKLQSKATMRAYSDACNTGTGQCALM